VGLHENMHQDINQTSSQSVNAKNINSNATDMFLAFTMVEKVVTELSDAVKG
jgi:hypothetical protein